MLESSSPSSTRAMQTVSLRFLPLSSTASPLKMPNCCKMPLSHITPCHVMSCHIVTQHEHKHRSHQHQALPFIDRTVRRKKTKQNKRETRETNAASISQLVSRSQQKHMLQLVTRVWPTHHTFPDTQRQQETCHCIEVYVRSTHGGAVHQERHYRVFGAALRWCTLCRTYFPVQAYTQQSPKCLFGEHYYCCTVLLLYCCYYLHLRRLCGSNSNTTYTQEPIDVPARQP